MSRRSLLVAAWMGGALIACSPARKADRGWLAQVYPLKRPEIERGIATASPPSGCLMERLRPEALKQDVARLESRGINSAGELKNFSREELPWLKLPLAHYKPSQVGFLARWGDQLPYIEGKDFHSCQHVPCLLNLIYGKDADSIEGWLTYAWYLETGAVISINGVIPGRSYPEEESQPSLEQQFFDLQELRALRVVSLMVPGSLKNLSSFKTLHRLSRGYRLSKGSCGLAVYDSGANIFQIILDDACLKTYPDDRVRERDSIHYSMIHELGHHFDYSEKYNFFRKNQKSKIRLSWGAQWASRLGWEFDEGVAPDGSAGEKQIVFKPWRNREAIEIPPTEYAAKGGPQEDFADSIAMYRLFPEWAAKRIPQRVAILKELVFDGKSYDRKSLDQEFLNRILQGVRERLAHSVAECIQTENVATSPTLEAVVPSFKLEGVLGMQTSHCLDGAIKNTVLNLIQQIRHDELEGCDVLSEERSRQVLDEVFMELREEVIQVSRNGELAKKISIILEQAEKKIFDRMDPRETAIVCYSESDPESCYLHAVQAALQEVLGGIDVHGDERIRAELRGLEKRYLDQYSYERSLALARSVYRELLVGMNLQVDRVAKTTWDRCWEKSGYPAEDEKNPNILFEPYSGGINFVHPILLNCINRSFVADLDRARDAANTSGLRVSKEKSAQFIRVVFQQEYLDSISGLLEPKRREEEKWVAASVVTIVDGAYRHLRRARKWVFGAKNRKQLRGNCESEALKNSDLPKDVILRFHAGVDLQNKISTLSCNRIFEEAFVKEWIVRLEQKEWLASLGRLNGLMDHQVELAANSCYDAHPGAQSQQQKRQKQCLDSGWLEIVKRAVESWLQTAEGAVFASRSETANARLTHNKQQFLWRGYKHLERLRK